MELKVKIWNIFFSKGDENYKTQVFGFKNAKDAGLYFESQTDFDDYAISYGGIEKIPLNPFQEEFQEILKFAKEEDNHE